MNNPPKLHDLFDALVAVTTALDKADIEYAVGGAIALGLWGKPRATDDIDLSIRKRLILRWYPV